MPEALDTVVLHGLPEGRPDETPSGLEEILSGLSARGCRVVLAGASAGLAAQVGRTLTLPSSAAAGRASSRS